MNKLLKNITNLICFLPERDRVLADEFLKKRDFESLKELVYSDWYKAHNMRKKLRSAEYKSLNIPQLESLYTYICEYITIVYDGLIDSDDTDGNMMFIGIEELIAMEEGEENDENY